MSLSSFQNGTTYQIFNVMFSTQNAELLSPGGVDGVLGGYHNNSDSGRMQWVVILTGTTNSPLNPVITIYNQELGTYAGIPFYEVMIPISTPVQGEQDPDMQVEWYVSPVDGNNTYVIQLYEDFNLAWTLGDGNDGTPITLEEVSATDSAQANQQWTFVPL